jgi:type IV pilus assembly protein PilB
MRVSLGKLLVDRNVITQEQLDAALAHHTKNRRPLGQTLVELGITTVDEILKALGEQFGVPATRINAYTMDPSTASALPERVARKHMALPLFRVGNTLTVAIPNPRDLKALDDLRFASSCEINPVVALAEEIGPALDTCYRGSLRTPLADEEGVVVVEEAGAARAKGDEEADQSAVIRLVDQILARAAADRASDVHLEPQEKSLRVRLRIDGVLSEVANLPAPVAPAVTARLKVLGAMDISERRLPQDGRIRATIGPRRLDLRISTYPTVWGEKTVLRLLDRTASRFTLGDIGMSPATLAAYRELIHRPEGIILITGPTGSGKTSTLYATLNEIRQQSGVNIVTIENPVEYELDGINQGQTNDKAGFTFATGFRAILRQDPDVIFVGEIRDKETLDVAIEASLTGHLVFSTLHTNSAVASVTRLIEMGLEPYLMSSAVLCVMAQRLVRRICEHCRTPMPIPSEVLRFFPSPAPRQTYHGVGCKDCRQTGYRGRAGIFEMLRMTDELRHLVLQRAAEAEMDAVNRKNGFLSLREEGIARVVAGLTTLDEVLTSTQARE